MKKKLIIVLLLSFFEISTLLGVSNLVASIPVEFTAGISYNIGLSKNMVSGTIKPGVDSFYDTATKIYTVPFSPSSDFQYYTTGTFYIYFQSFVTSKVTIKVVPNLLECKKTDGTTSSLGYKNTGSNTKNFTVSADNIGDTVTLYEIAKRDANSLPTVYNMALNLNIPVSDVKEEGTYTGEIKVIVEGVE